MKRILHGSCLGSDPCQLVAQHEQNTRCEVWTAVADHKYGTAETLWRAIKRAS
ncbi:MAG TPA: hypothetical protein VH413_07090 [Verrucomicrobiae bacterium]|nr:hypothetical protein [Verrucomicrobiae bacterium]